MKINSEAHYTQCFMHDPCDRSSDGSHISYRYPLVPSGWGLCQECDCECICSRLVDMRNEGRQNGLDAARDAVAALPWTSETWQAHGERAAVLAAIDALREKP